MGSDPNVAGGGKLATRVMQLVTQGIVSTHAGLAGVKRNASAAVLGDFFDLVSGEVRHTTAPFLQPIAEHPATPETMRPLFAFLATGNGQWQAIAGQAVVGTAVGTGLGALLTNELQVVTGRLIALNPNLPMTVADAARAQATGFTGTIDMAYEAAQQGIEGGKFDQLVELSRPRPGITEILALLNRGQVNDDYANTLLRENGFTGSDAGLLKELRRLLIEPATLADLVVRTELTADQGAELAALNGVTGDDFALLVRATGDAPAPQELLFAYRRGLIDDARLAQGIAQSRLRNEWFDVIKSLGQVPMSTADAITAAVKNHLTTDEARAIAQQNGLIPSQFDPLLASAGNPPGNQEMLHLWNRDIVTEAEVDQALRESHLNNKYIAAVKAAREQLPTEPQILSMLRKGVISEARGRQLLKWRGYGQDVIDGLVAEATKTPAETVKQLSLGAVRTLYLDRAIDTVAATARLKALGYTDLDAALEVQLVDEQRNQRYVSAVITRIHREYVAGLLTADEATAFLTQLEVPADQVSAELALWDVEKATVRRSLTEAQVAAALKRHVISSDEAVARWQTMGYSPDDAAILLALATPANATPAGNQ